MDCRETLASLADLSADCLATPGCAEELSRHLEACPPCRAEWVRFQHTLLLLSGSGQPVASRVQSQAMWGVCLEQILEETERKRNLNVPITSSVLGKWLAIQPRWSWAALGGALAVLGGVWMFAPHADAPLADTPRDYREAQVISFERPPAGAYSMIGRHAAMSFDGFNDHVGSTLVSLSASEPIDAGSRVSTYQSANPEGRSLLTAAH